MITYYTEEDMNKEKERTNISHKNSSIFQNIFLSICRSENMKNKIERKDDVAKGIITKDAYAFVEYHSPEYLLERFRVILKEEMKRKPRRIICNNDFKFLDVGCGIGT